MASAPARRASLAPQFRPGSPPRPGPRPIPRTGRCPVPPAYREAAAPVERARPTVSIILPTYNERDAIATLVREVLESLDGFAVEVVVVDDDSPDGTWQVVEHSFRGDPRVKVRRRIGDRGLTKSIEEGIRASTGDWVAWMDADFSHPPATLPALAAALADCDVAVGSRYVAGAADVRGCPCRVVASAVLNCFAQLLLGRRVHDYSSGFVMARREVLHTLPLVGGYGEYCIDFLCRAQRAGYRVAEVPFANVPRREGQTKTSANPVSFAAHGLTYLRTILRLAWEGRETWNSAAAT